MNLSAFILAAGLGERLRPITNHIPKPLLPILGKPVLQSVLEKISALPVISIGLNLHHKKEVLENWIKQSLFTNNVQLFPEDPILGTGGALKNAAAFLRDSTFLVHNSDIISDIDLHRLIDYHLSSDNIATLAVHNNPEFNRLILDKNGLLKNIVKYPHPYPPPSRGRESSGIPPSYSNSLPLKIPPSFGGRGLGGGGYKILAFTGIAVYQPEFLKFLPAGISSVVDTWLNAISKGYKIGTFDVTGYSWNDIGKPVSYAKAVINELRKNGETVYVHPSVRDCSSFEIDGYVAIENESISDQGISLRNCIVLPETEIDIKDHFENCILGPGFRIDLSESDFFDSAEGNSSLIGTGGSDRKYYRVKPGKHSAVLMQSPDGDPDFQRHIEYTQFFRGHSIPVPELIDIAHDKKTALFEDFGDLSLYSWLKCPRDLVMIEKMYKKVIDILILIHTEVTEHVSECPLLRKRIFDYEHLRWETGYFVERFVSGIRKIKIANELLLNDDFHRLAEKVDSFNKTAIHRDFQSHNIMLTKGESPGIIDYQGARIGPPAYDIVSLLWDPYFRLDDDIREKLLDYYIKRMSENSRWFRQNEFRETLVHCRLQRHMQALGAYGFLSSVKGKKYFLKYVPEGLRLLKEDIELAKEEYPELYKLVISIP